MYPFSFLMVGVDARFSHFVWFFFVGASVGCKLVSAPVRVHGKPHLRPLRHKECRTPFIVVYCKRRRIPYVWITDVRLHSPF